MTEDGDCGVGTVDIPQDLFVLTDVTQNQVIGVYCNPWYASLYGSWMKKKRPYSQFTIQKTHGNPERETINQW